MDLFITAITGGLIAVLGGLTVMWAWLRIARIRYNLKARRLEELKTKRRRLEVEYRQRIAERDRLQAEQTRLLDTLKEQNLELNQQTRAAFAAVETKETELRQHAIDEMLRRAVDMADQYPGVAIIAAGSLLEAVLASLVPAEKRDRSFEDIVEDLRAKEGIPGELHDDMAYLWSLRNEWVHHPLDQNTSFEHATRYVQRVTDVIDRLEEIRAHAHQ